MASKADQVHVEVLYNLKLDLLLVMEDKNVSKAELGRRLGVSRSRVDYIFSSESSLTLRTISNCCIALGIKPRIKLTED